MIRRGWVVLALLALSSIGHGANPVDYRRDMAPHSGSHVLQSFDLKQKVKVLAIGKGGRGFSGLYIFDAHGNCVSWADSTHREIQDDLAVEFTTSAAGSYLIEVRNMAPVGNSFTISVK